MIGTVNFLKPLIGSEKTLLISCFECFLDSQITADPNILNQTSLANLSYSHDATHEEIIKYHLEVSGCTKVIIIGDTRCKAIDQLLKAPLSTRYMLGFQRKLKKILKNNHADLLAIPSRKRMLVETNVIDRCRTTLEFPCSKKKVAAKMLSIVGVVISSGTGGRIVFKNGIVLNNLTTMN